MDPAAPDQAYAGLAKKFADLEKEREEEKREFAEMKRRFGELTAKQEADDKKAEEEEGKAFSAAVAEKVDAAILANRLMRRDRPAMIAAGEQLRKNPKLFSAAAESPAAALADWGRGLMDRPLVTHQDPAPPPDPVRPTATSRTVEGLKDVAPRSYARLTGKK